MAPVFCARLHIKHRGFLPSSINRQVGLLAEVTCWFRTGRIGTILQSGPATRISHSKGTHRGMWAALPCGELTHWRGECQFSALSIGSEIHATMGANGFTGCIRMWHRRVISGECELTHSVARPAFHAGNEDSEQAGSVPLWYVVPARWTCPTRHSRPTSWRAAS